MDFPIPSSFMQNHSKISCLTYNPDINLLITGDFDGIVKFWNFKTKRVVSELDMKNHDSSLLGATGIIRLKLFINLSDSQESCLLIWSRSSQLFLVKFGQNLQNLLSGRSWPKNFKFNFESITLIFRTNFFGYCQPDFFQSKADSDLVYAILPETTSDDHHGFIGLAIKFSESKNGCQITSRNFTKNHGPPMACQFYKDSDQFISVFESGNLIIFDRQRKSPKCVIQVSTSKSQPLTCCNLYNDQLIIGGSENILTKIHLTNLLNFNKNKNDNSKSKPISKNDIFNRIEIKNQGIRKILLCAPEKAKSENLVPPLLVAVCWDQRIRVFDLNFDQNLEKLTLLAVFNCENEFFDESCQAITYDEKNDTLILGSQKGQIAIWKGFYRIFEKNK